MILAAIPLVIAAVAAPPQGVPSGCDSSVMSEKYWSIWNADEQARIDADIERYRKADAVFAVPAPAGTEVTVEQLDHEFRFGAHIFNFDQLGRHDWNEIYKRSYGPGGIFNQATVAFYWDNYEPTPGAFRAAGAYEDSERYWNSLTRDEAMGDFRWRRPSPGPVIRFLKGRGVRVHGHILIWGSAKPSWIWDEYCPEEEQRAFADWGLTTDDPYAAHSATPLWTGAYVNYWRSAWQKISRDLSEEEIAARMPVFCERYRRLFRDRVKGVAERFGDVVDSWDVVNESAQDQEHYGRSRTGLKVWKSAYGIMPGDYPLHALLDAKEFMPSAAKLAINDYHVQQSFLDQVQDLGREGAKIDIVGCQMHIFETNNCRRLAEGADNINWVGTPETVQRRLDMMAKTGKKIHVSEITITSPGPDEKSRQIQAILTRNLYRKWFSHPAMMGITWWNTVDGGGVKGEPLVSGLFTVDMQKKPAYNALDELINHEWHTSFTAPTIKQSNNLKSNNSLIRFRGFRGKYRLSWKDSQGLTCTRIAYLGDEGGDSEARQAEIAAHPERFSKMPRNRREPTGEIVRKVTAKGAFGTKQVELKVGEKLFDVDEIAGVVLQGTDGKPEPSVTLSFPVYAAEPKTVTLEFTNDWYGRILVNGREQWKVDGPTGEWGARPLRLAQGENVISFETWHGLSPDWITGLAITR